MSIFFDLTTFLYLAPPPPSPPPPLPPQFPVQYNFYMLYVAIIFNLSKINVWVYIYHKIKLLMIMNYNEYMLCINKRFFSKIMFFIEYI